MQRTCRPLALGVVSRQCARHFDRHLREAGAFASLASSCLQVCERSSSAFCLAVQTLTRSSLSESICSTPRPSIDTPKVHKGPPELYRANAYRNIGHLQSAPSRGSPFPGTEKSSTRVQNPPYCRRSRGSGRPPPRNNSSRVSSRRSALPAVAQTSAPARWPPSPPAPSHHG